MAIYHCCVDVRGMLKNATKRELASMFRHDDGRRMTADEAKDALLDCIASGKEVIPYGTACDGFDYKTGCPGHDHAKATEAANG